MLSQNSGAIAFRIKASESELVGRSSFVLPTSCTDRSLGSHGSRASTGAAPNKITSRRAGFPRSQQPAEDRDQVGTRVVVEYKAKVPPRKYIHHHRRELPVARRVAAYSAKRMPRLASMNPRE